MMKLFKKEYKYFIAFKIFMKGGAEGAGNTVAVGRKIKGMEQILELEGAIARNTDAENIKITGFKLI